MEQKIEIKKFYRKHTDVYHTRLLTCLVCSYSMVPCDCVHYYISGFLEGHLNYDKLNYLYADNHKASCALCLGVFNMCRHFKFDFIPEIMTTRLSTRFFGRKNMFRDDKEATKYVKANAEQIAIMLGTGILVEKPGSHLVHIRGLERGRIHDKCDIWGDDTTEVSTTSVVEKPILERSPELAFVLGDDNVIIGEN